jgi:Glycosyltransferase family 87
MADPVPRMNGSDARAERIETWVMAAIALVLIVSDVERTLPNHGLWDFGSFVASARAAREGLNPYGVYPLTMHVVLPGFDTWNPNLNPPVSALLFRAFDLAEPEASLRVWWAVSVACYVATVLLLVARYRRSHPVALALPALALAGFWDTLFLGQIYLPLVLAATVAWLLLERGQGTLAGILIGLVVAMKPNFLVWPVLLVLARHYRPAVVAVATAAVVSAIPLLWWGPEVYRQWVELIASDRERAAFLTNASLTGLAARAGAAGLGIALSLCLLACLAAWALLRRPDPLRASAFALLASVFASPIGWIHYTLFLLPVLVVGWGSRVVRAVVLLLMVPVPFVVGQLGSSVPNQLTVGSVYGWALALCLLALVADARLTTLPARKGAERL